MLNENEISEISRELPAYAAGRKFAGGEPILCAYECALLERETPFGFIYTVVNLLTGKKTSLLHRKTPLLSSEIPAVVEKIRKSKVAGAGNLQAERFGTEQISLDKARKIVTAVFRDIMPKYGYQVRESQVDLALHNLKTISQLKTTLAEAETGTGKTDSYLIPAIIAKRGNLNTFANTNLYPDMQEAEIHKMPIVIATSSIALQRAIMTEYIPKLSQILLENGVIKTPLTAVLRKGKEHYVCVKNLLAHLSGQNNSVIQLELEKLLPPSTTIDLAETELSQHEKDKICVSGKCSDYCQHKETCAYLKFRNEASGYNFDIQVCNHNYLLADTLCRAKKQNPLIPNYQMLIVDEAHKILSVARTMYGAELSETAATNALTAIDKLKFRREDYQELAQKTALKLCGENARLFRALLESVDETDSEDDNNKTRQFAVTISKTEARHIRNMRDITERLTSILRDEAFYVKALELLVWIKKRYKADISAINLKKIFSETYEDIANYDNAKHMYRTLLIRLYQAIIALPDVFRRINGNSSNIDKAIWRRLNKLHKVESPFGSASEWVIRLIWRLNQLHEQLSELADYSSLITWLETNYDCRRNGETLKLGKLCAIPKNLNEKLFDDQWSKGIPTIFTSGTLSAAGDFTHTKHTLGLEKLGTKLSETSKPSPFDYQNNALLYIPENMPFPNSKDKQYITAITNEIEKLISASNGRAAVLFTSYDAMGRVYSELEKRKLPQKLFRLDKGGVREIERFKKSGNGVLFASGALWEGIDIPGDALSMLIIVKLPFAVPDAISEYEKSLYIDLDEYKHRVIIPEMLIKLKQGFGRLIRTEFDTGCVAILDCRVAENGSYRKPALTALPPCRTTSKITEIAEFLRIMKPREYFM